MVISQTLQSGNPTAYKENQELIAGLQSQLGGTYSGGTGGGLSSNLGVGGSSAQVNYGGPDPSHPAYAEYLRSISSGGGGFGGSGSFSNAGSRSAGGGGFAQ
jgi:hypothetical protein